MLNLTIHQRLTFAFSLSAVLLTTIGIMPVLNYPPEIILILVSMSVAVVMVIGFLIYLSITKPIDAIKRAVREISKGNFDVEIKGKSAYSDELGELARYIDRMKIELKEKERMKDEFINIASHELRTPIQPILSYSELAKRGIVNPEVALETVISQARRLKVLAEDILDVSRIEGNRLLLHREYFNIHEVIGQMVEEKRVSLSKDVTLSLAPGASEVIIFADKSRIIQVLTNVIANAIKFTKKGSIELRCSMLEGRDNIEIAISDTGAGIPSDMFSKLFTKFGSKSVESGTEHGTGLGLFICKGIVEAHGGTISALNNEREGATFRIVLPIKKSEEPLVSQPAAVKEKPRLFRRKYRACQEALTRYVSIFWRRCAEQGLYIYNLYRRRNNVDALSQKRSPV